MASSGGPLPPNVAGTGGQRATRELSQDRQRWQARMPLPENDADSNVRPVPVVQLPRTPDGRNLVGTSTRATQTTGYAPPRAEAPNGSFVTYIEQEPQPHSIADSPLPPREQRLALFLPASFFPLDSVEARDAVSTCEVEGCCEAVFCALGPCRSLVCREHLGVVLRTARVLPDGTKLFLCVHCGADANIMAPAQTQFRPDSSYSPRYFHADAPSATPTLPGAYHWEQAYPGDGSVTVEESPALSVESSRFPPPHAPDFGSPPSSYQGSVGDTFSPIVFSDAFSPIVFSDTGTFSPVRINPALPPVHVLPSPPTSGNSITAGPGLYPIVKIENIPFHATVADLENFLPPYTLPHPADVPLAVHIVLHRATGKTLPHAYVQVNGLDAGHNLLLTRDGVELHARRLKVKWAKRGELRRDLFQQDYYFVSLSGRHPVINAGQMSATSPDTGPLPRPLFAEGDLESVVALCRGESRTVPLERPYMHLVSLVSQFPWSESVEDDIPDRDRLFHAIVQAIHILRLRPPQFQHKCLNLFRESIRRSRFTSTQVATIEDLIELPVQVNRPHGHNKRLSAESIDFFPPLSAARK